MDKRPVLVYEIVGEIDGHEVASCYIDTVTVVNIQYTPFDLAKEEPEIAAKLDEWMRGG